MKFYLCGIPWAIVNQRIRLLKKWMCNMHCFLNMTLLNCFRLVVHSTIVLLNYLCSRVFVVYLLWYCVMLQYSLLQCILMYTFLLHLFLPLRTAKARTLRLYIIITINSVCDCRQCVAAIKPVVVPKVTSVTFQIRSASRLPPTTSNPCWRRFWQPSQKQSNNNIEIMTCHVQAVHLAQMGRRVVCWHRASTAAVRTQTWVVDSFRTRHILLTRFPLNTQFCRKELWLVGCVNRAIKGSCRYHITHKFEIFDHPYPL